jgi:hypothetical protein
MAAKVNKAILKSQKIVQNDSSICEEIGESTVLASS